MFFKWLFGGEPFSTFTCEVTEAQPVSTSGVVNQMLTPQTCLHPVARVCLCKGKHLMGSC